MVTVFRLVRKVAYFNIFNKRSDIIKDDMGEIDFMEENEFHIRSRRLLGEPTTPSMVQFLLKSGVAKDEKQALLILIATVSIIILLTIYLANILLFDSNSVNYVEDKFGNRYTAQEYLQLIKSGKDPLSPNFKP